ncbi:hypothetical protein CEXT_727091 [Caerostris extrusa]|uniref:Uncharacterized protein n=1 Tax=Caerostris extrusa TaxID=172846 RepID=A0AAV4NAZ3_CAEEX|nr:hypothetical protein CEXT_727091 [Caerostris extrusa]
MYPFPPIRPTKPNNFQNNNQESKHFKQKWNSASRVMVFRGFLRVAFVGHMADNLRKGKKEVRCFALQFLKPLPSGKRMVFKFLFKSSKEFLFMRKLKATAMSIGNRIRQIILIMKLWFRVQLEVVMVTLTKRGIPCGSRSCGNQGQLLFRWLLVPDKMDITATGIG